MLNSREVATIIWLGIALVFAFSQPGVRLSLLNAVKAFFRRKILASLCFILLYTVGAVWLLHAMNLWTVALLKDTILWFFFVAIPLVVSFVTSKQHKNVFPKIIRDNARAIIILEYLIGAYTFSLPIELILLPFVTLVVMLDVVARRDEKYSIVAKITAALQVAIGLAIVLFAISAAVEDYERVLGIASVRTALLAPLLSILFAPFIYLMVLYSHYEDLFIWVDLGIKKEKQLKAYAKRRLIGHLGFDLHGSQTFLNAHGRDLMKIQTRDDIDRLLKAHDT